MKSFPAIVTFTFERLCQTWKKFPWGHSWDIMLTSKRETNDGWKSRKHSASSCICRWCRVLKTQLLPGLAEEWLLSSQFIYVSIFIFNKTSSDCFQLTQGSQTQILHFFLHFTNSTEVKDTAQREVHRGQFIFVWNMQKKWGVLCRRG